MGAAYGVPPDILERAIDQAGATSLADVDYIARELKRAYTQSDNDWDRAIGIYARETYGNGADEAALNIMGKGQSAIGQAYDNVTNWMGSAVPTIAGNIGVIVLGILFLVVAFFTFKGGVVKTIKEAATNV